MTAAALDVRATELRETLHAIAEKNDGRLAPETVLKAAEDPDSPLHDCFNWSNDEAAHHWRLAQAGALIRRVKLTIVRKAVEEKSVVLTVAREFQSRPSQRTPEGGYESVAVIMGDHDKRAEMLAAAMKELAAVRKRYQELEELAEVWEAVEALVGS